MEMDGKDLRCAVALGFPISYSSIFDFDHGHPRCEDLDHVPVRGWNPKTVNPGEWVGVCLINPRVVRKIEIRGRQGDPLRLQYVKAFKIKYSLDGKNWHWYNNGEILKGNTDPETPVIHNVIPFQAVSVRLYHVEHNASVCIRFEVYYSDD